MRAYTYDPCGHFVQAIRLDQDPLVPGRFLVPPNCTPVAPPSNPPAGKVARFNGRTWDFVFNPHSHSHG